MTICKCIHKQLQICITTNSTSDSNPNPGYNRCILYVVVLCVAIKLGVQLVFNIVASINFNLVELYHVKVSTFLLPFLTILSHEHYSLFTLQIALDLIASVKSRALVNNTMVG